MAHSRRTFTATAAGLAVAGAAQAQAQTQAKTLTEPPSGPWTEDGVIERPGMRIHYVGLGSGPPLILLHKLGVWVADWRHVAPALAKTHRVIAIDMPGHGDSTIAGPAPFLVSLAESAAVIVAALDELKIETFDLVGCSLGGTCAVLIAALWPERVKRLGLLSVALTAKNSREAIEKASNQPEVWAADGTPLVRSFEDSTRMFGITDRAIHDEQNASRAKGGAWVRASQRGVAAAGVADYLPRITASTLLIYGDRGASYRNYDKIGREGLKRVRVVRITDTSAFTQQEKPRETEAALLTFLAEST